MRTQAKQRIEQRVPAPPPPAAAPPRRGLRPLIWVPSLILLVLAILVVSASP